MTPVLSDASQADEEYQQEFRPPPQGSVTGLGSQEKVIPVEDPAHDQEQVQHRSDTQITYTVQWNPDSSPT